MSVTVEDVKKVAHLARIKIKDSEIAEIQSSMNQILNFVEQLNQVDCSNVDDDVQYVSKLHERKDIAVQCDHAVMNNAPEKELNMFVVPKVVS